MKARRLIWTLCGVFALAAILGGCDDDSGQFSTGDSAILVAEPEIVTFAQVPVGETVNRVVKVRNEGTATLYLTFDNYILSPSDADYVFTYMTNLAGEQIEQLEPGGEAEILITYYPQPPVVGRATLTLASDNGGTVDIELQSVAPAPILEVQPNPVAFGSVPQGSQAELEVTVTNQGSEDLVIDELTYVAENTADFILLTNLATPVTLTPGASDSFMMRYEPTGNMNEPDRGKLVFISNSATAEGTNGRTVVDVLGGVSAPLIDVAPAFLDFGGVELGGSKTETLTVSNLGEDPLIVSDVYLTLGTSTDFSYSDQNSFTLNPGETTTLEVVYTANDSAFDSGELALDSNDPSSPTVAVPLSGQWAGPDLVVKPLTLDFGQVSTGISKTLTFDVFNRGLLPMDVTDMIKQSFPSDGSLTIAPQGGSASSVDPFSIFTLGPNQKQTIAVTYAPVAETPPTSASLVVEATDPDQPTETVQITFSGVPNGTCNPEVVPVKLNFGLVPGGYGKTLPLLVRNKGAGVCDVVNVRLSSNGLIFGSSPFSFATTFQPFALGPGEVRYIDIDYYPYSGGDTEEFFAQVVFTINDRLNGTQNLACPSPPFNPLGGDLCLFGSLTGPPGDCWACVTGKTGDPALAAVPGEAEFGLVTFGCKSQPMRIKLYNKGTAPTNVQSIELDPSCPSSFALTGVPPMPASMPAGTFVEFELQYTPTPGVAEETCNVIITGDTESFTLPATGKGTTDEFQQDVYDQVSGREVDVLFVVDNSGSMGDDQNNLANNFQSFINAAQTWGVDFQIGVVTTDGGDEGKLQARNGHPRILTPTTPNLSSAFGDNIRVGTSGSATERGLQAADNALTDPNITADVPADCPAKGGFGVACGGQYGCDTIDGTCGGYNARFLREDASLEIIFVSDENDQSGAVLDFYVDLFKSIKGYRNDSLMHAHAIVGSDSANGCSTSGFQRYHDVADRTGGLKESLCGNFASSLGNIGNNAFGLRVQFFLSRVPVPASVKVFVDGVEQTVGWSYDQTSNSVIFDDTNVPQANAQVQIDYKAACYQ